MGVEEVGARRPMKYSMGTSNASTSSSAGYFQTISFFLVRAFLKIYFAYEINMGWMARSVIMSLFEKGGENLSQASGDLRFIDCSQPPADVFATIEFRFDWLIGCLKSTCVLSFSFGSSPLKVFLENPSPKFRRTLTSTEFH